MAEPHINVIFEPGKAEAVTESAQDFVQQMLAKIADSMGMTYEEMQEQHYHAARADTLAYWHNYMALQKSNQDWIRTQFQPWQDRVLKNMMPNWRRVKRMRRKALERAKRSASPPDETGRRFLPLFA